MRYWYEFQTIVLSLIVTAVFCSGCSQTSIFKPRTSPFELGGDELRVPQHRESNLQWLESWEIASSQAARDGKLVMADFTGSDWCSWCKKLDREVFSTTEFSAWAASNVVLLKVDFPRNTRQDPQIQQLNEELAKKYATHIGGYPTVLFLRPDGSVAGTIGYEAGGPEAWIHKAEKSMHSAP